MNREISTSDMKFLHCTERMETYPEGKTLPSEEAPSHRDSNSFRGREQKGKGSLSSGTTAHESGPYRHPTDAADAAVVQG